MEDGGHNVIKARRFRMVDDCVVHPPLRKAEETWGWTAGREVSGGAERVLAEEGRGGLARYEGVWVNRGAWDVNN